MRNFSIKKQIEKEIKDFESTYLTLAKTKRDHKGTLRYGENSENSGYTFNQQAAIALIDMYYNSKFESGAVDQYGYQKIFLNIGKFRCDVASKQIDIDVKDFRFIPEDGAYTWVAFFMQREFKEYAKESYFGELVNDFVDDFPKYGTIVAKKINGRIDRVPLQLLRNEQSAETLQDAAYVHELHPRMTVWELQKMKNWNLDGLDMRMDREYDVVERYGYVPLGWIKQINGEPNEKVDWDEYVDAMVIATFDWDERKTGDQEHIFYATEVKERPYLEAHWDKQHGRWLGIGQMENLVENQQAVNAMVNLKRRGIQWSARKIFQTTTTEMAAKNLLKDVADGDILEVGPSGNLSQVDMTTHSMGEFNDFLNLFDKNADQKAFTYEVATGESLPSGTPFRLGALLTNAVNSYYGLKREKLGMFLKKVIIEFLVPEFVQDMSKEDKIVTMYSDEPGYDMLKVAAMDYVKAEAVRLSLLSGKEVDSAVIDKAVKPFDAIRQMFFNRSKDFYKEAKVRFDLVVTGESEDIQRKIESLTTIWRILQQAGDRRADVVFERIAALTGENLNAFGVPKSNVPVLPPQQGAPGPANQVAESNAQPQPAG